MKTQILSALLILLSVAPLHATTIGGRSFKDDKTNIAARKLLTRLKKQKPLAGLATPLLQFTLSPEQPLQNQNVNLFITPNTSFGGRKITVDATLNGAEVNLENPTNNFWSLPMGVQTEIKTHNLHFTKYIENTQDNTSIRQSITQLDSQINSLTNQINAERDAARRRILQESRAEKVALKTELIEQLKKLRVKVGEQNYSFQVKANAGDNTLPRINSVSPSSGDVNGGTAVTLTGVNFTNSFTAKVGTLTVLNPEFIDSETIVVTTPAFSGNEGPKDIELRFIDGQGAVKNAVAPSAFFARTVPVGAPVNTRPVAVAGGSQKINQGLQAQIDASASYDEQEDELNYEWRVLSSPAGSLRAPGSFVASTAIANFTPDVYGTFVLKLVVQEQETSEHLMSEPSLVVIESVGAPNPTVPLIAVRGGKRGTAQVSHGNPNPGHANTYSLTTAPTHGTASVNSLGLVTYTADAAYDGPDSYVVTVTDQFGLTGTVTGEVTVIVANRAPDPIAPAISAYYFQTVTSQINPRDPDLEIPELGEQVTYTIVKSPALGTATVSSSGLVTFSPNNTQEGTDSVAVFVADLEGKHGLVDIPITVIANAAPIVGTLSTGILAVGAPYEVILSSETPITDPDGTIVSQIWNFGDGTSERSTNPIASLTHNYIATGTYTATLTVTDNVGAVTVRTIEVNVVDTDIPTAKFTADTFAGSSPLTINFDASAASDSDGIAQYRWNWGLDPTLGGDEVVTSPTHSHTFTQSGVFNVRLIVVDNVGAVNVKTVTVFVDEAPPVPVHPSVPDMQVLPSRLAVLGNAHNFYGAGSFNPNIGGSVTDYFWNFRDFTLPGGGTASGISASNTYSELGNYFPTLEVAGPDGVQFQMASQEVYVVNSGFAPRAVPVASTTQGVAPLTVTFTSESYDYDGTIQTHLWGFGSDPNCSNTNCSPTGQSVQYTFENPGAYLVQLTAVDNDANIYNSFMTIRVDSPLQAKKKAKKLSAKSNDPWRERNRQMLTNLCARGNGDSCFYLSKMYEEDGDTVLAAQLRARSCTLGYQEACAQR